ncbi:MAG: hypothetical protein SO205_08515, partial [Bulleidia sp.]|nr:hypothetical protein [Bulleidia sp.]
HRIAIFQEVLKEDHQVFHAKQKNRQQGDLIHTFLDEVGDIDAIVCANDELAICTYDVLKKRNMKVGVMLLCLA